MLKKGKNPLWWQVDLFFPNMLNKEPVKKS